MTSAPSKDSESSFRYGCTARDEFRRRKQQILASLDRSPKGSLDAPIVDLLSWLNAQADIVTTSSCSGRISIFLGSSNPTNSKGGEWLLCSHEQVIDAKEAWTSLKANVENRDAASLQSTMISFLLEPFLLHAECVDVETAQRVLEAAREVGLRESGLSLGRRRVMVQLRSLALRLEVPLALDGNFLIDSNYFEILMQMANNRLMENECRIARLWDRLRENLASKLSKATMADDVPWVLACPNAMARGLKLALEDRGWMDESRKMAAFARNAESNGDKQNNQIGIPINRDGASFLEALIDAELDEDVASNSAVDRPSVSAKQGAEEGTSDGYSNVEGEKHKSEKRTKAERAAAAAQPADIESLWCKLGGSKGGIQLVQSNELPQKQTPVQKGTTGSERVLDCEKLVQAAAEAHTKFCSNEENCSLSTLLDELRAMGQLQWRGDVALLPRDGLLGGGCEVLAERSKGEFWEILRASIGARLLARQQEIRVDDGVRGGAVQILAGTGDGWVIVPGPRGVRYTFDITRCMFSEGNASEKTRVADWSIQGETVLDLYAGIGFWTLPLLVAGADHVIACEWNPDATEALRRGLALLNGDLAARCEVLEGDNRRQEVIDCVAGRCHRVMLGLIPTSRDGFPVAVAALRNEGGILHVHWNVSSDAEDRVAEAIADELQTCFRAARGEGWCCHVLSVQRIKWYAPRVRHVRIDVECKCHDQQS